MYGRGNSTKYTVWPLWEKNRKKRIDIRNYCAVTTESNAVHVNNLIPI